MPDDQPFRILKSFDRASSLGDPTALSVDKSKGKDFDAFIESLEKKVRELQLSKYLVDRNEVKVGFLDWVREETGLPRIVGRVFFSLLVKVARKVEGEAVSSLFHSVTSFPLVRKLLEEKYVQEKILSSLETLGQSLETLLSGESAKLSWGADEWEDIKKWLEESQDKLGVRFTEEIDTLRTYNELSQPQLDKRHIEYIDHQGSTALTEDGIEKFLSPQKGSIPFHGRVDEIEALNTFFSSGKFFSLWVIEGPSGSGKTRLALEWMSRALRGDTEWDAGFMSEGKGWERWIPLRPTLIVIDYFTRNSEVVGTIIARLQTLQNNKNNMVCPVRILILDHQFDFASLIEDHRWKGVTSVDDSMRLEEKLLYKQEPLNIETSDKWMLQDIVKDIAGDKYAEEKGKDAMRWIEKEEGASNPLFAALAGWAIKEGEDFIQSSRRGLVKMYLRGAKRLVWLDGENPAQGQLAACYMCCSTALGGGVDRGFLENRLATDLPMLGDIQGNSWQHARILVGQDINGSEFLRGLLPDIVGETFFLLFMSTSRVDERVRGKVVATVFDQKNLDVLGNILEFCRRTSLNLCQGEGEDRDYIRVWLKFLLEYTEDVESDEGKLLLALAKLVSATAFSQRMGSRDERIEHLLFDVGRVLSDKKTEKYKGNLYPVMANAFRAGNIIFAEKLTEAGWDVNTILNENKATSLMFAIANGHEGMVKLLIEKGAKVDHANNDGLTSLMIAILSGHEGVMKILIENGADINYSNNNGFTSLMIASWKGHEGVVKLLIEKGADVNRAEKHNATSLMIASLSGHEGVVKLLIENGSGVDHANNDGVTSLMMAILSGHEGVVKLLIEKGADVDHANNDGVTSLMIAILSGHEGVVKLLIEKGADVDHKEKDNWTSLMFAIAKGHEGVVKLLIEKGADVDHVNDDGVTSLMIAILSGHEGVAKLLIENGADVDHSNNNGFTSLMFAIANGHEGVVKLLIEKGADVDHANNNGVTSLMIASQNGHGDVVRLLIEKGGDVNHADKDSVTSLIVASQNGHESVVRLLIEKDAKVDHADNGGFTSLMFASQNGHEGVVKFLIEKGAKVDHANKDNWTSLMVASQNGHEGVVKFLIEKGAKVDHANKDGLTSLMIASHQGHEGVVRLLIEKGADVDHANNDGFTSLMMASQQGHEGVVKFLLKHKADTKKKNRHGDTAMDIAKKKGHNSIVNLIKKHNRSKLR